MKRSTTIACSAVLMALPILFPATSAVAGSSFALHVGSNGFGLSVGTNDWGVHNGWWSGGATLSYGAALSGYGEWFHVTGLGRVWRPHVAAGWSPYTHGRWVYTEIGWTWVAYEPWGYIPHHYGEWALTGYGWAWVPGYVYRPAHVVWVNSGGCVGWYARPPRGWSHHHRAFHRGYRHGYGDGYSDGWRDARHATYVPWKHMGADNVSRHAVSHAAAAGRRGTPRTMARAPSLNEVSRHGGAAVQRAALERRSVTVDGRRTILARPGGIGPTVERHAGKTVERALAPEARRQVGRNVENTKRASRRESTSSPPAARAGGPRRTQSTNATRDMDRRSVDTGRRTMERQATSQSKAQSAARSRTRHVQNTTTQAPARSRGNRTPKAAVTGKPARPSTQQSTQQRNARGVEKKDRDHRRISDRKRTAASTSRIEAPARERQQRIAKTEDANNPRRR